MRWLLPAAILLAAVLAAGARASTRPRYGGTLRVQMRERLETIDPRRWPAGATQAAAADRLDSLVFDRLVRFGGDGAPRPALAVSWQHDTQARRWVFRLREGVKFADGAPLTPEAAALAVQQLLGNAFDVSASSDSVVIQSDQDLPDLLTRLASGRYFIFHVAEDGTLSGTGPFRVAEWPGGAAAGKDASATAAFSANESCWAGRPFVDRIEVTMGVDTEHQANAIAFGQADVVELPATEIRRATQRGVRTASSEPVDLFALRFDLTRPAVQDARVREAVSLAIDRASLADVILERQGMVAGALLPNWLSGYAYLFSTAPGLARSKQLWAAAGREVSRAAPLVLDYDSNDAEARAVAERVAVNLKEAAIAVQMTEHTGGGATKSAVADLQLVRCRIAVPHPGAALAHLFAGLGEASEAPVGLDTPDQTYAAERAAVDAFRVVPLSHVREGYGLGPRVRDWTAPRWGGWRLEEVWLDQAPAAGTTP